MDFDPADAPPGQRYFFHYTDCESARAIAEDQAFYVRKTGRFGPGMYVTDLVPDANYLDDVPEVAFDGAPPETLNGVVVVADTDPPTFFECNEPGNWSHLTSSEWEDLPIDELVAVGCFDGERWRWEPVDY